MSRANNCFCASCQFDTVDENFFTLDGYSEVMLFAITKRMSFLKPVTDKYSHRATKRILELADKLNLTIYALVDHAESCADNSMPDQTDVASTFSPVSVATGAAVPNFHPSERQKKFCYFAKRMLNHAKRCSSNGPCHAEYCQTFKDIIEYRFLFSRLRH
jgi:hypothetical protein